MFLYDPFYTSMYNYINFIIALLYMFSIFHHLKRIKVSRGCILVSFRRKIPIGFRFDVLLEAVLRVCHASFSI